MYAKWEEACLTMENKEKKISVFQKEKEKFVSTITYLENYIDLLKFKLENMPKFVCMLNNGLNMLYEILEVGKMFIYLKGICF